MTRAGRKQTLLDVQRATDVTSPTTGEISRTWASVAPAFGEITAAGGSQSFAAGEVQSGQDVDVTIRWRSGINSADYRFVHTNLWDSPPTVVVFDIQSIGDAAGTRRELVARCKVRFAEGLRGEST